MRRILMSLMVIAVAVLAVAGGTFAKFADSTTSVENKFTVGNVSVSVNSDDSESVSAIFTPTNIKPGDTGTASIHVQNVGSIKGCPFDMEISDVSNSEGHSLSSKIDIEIWEDKDHDSMEDAEELPLLYNGTLKSLEIEDKITQLDDAYVGFKWTFSEDASSLYMDTWCTANITFIVKQP